MTQATSYETMVGYSNGARIADDVILTNVIGFDVKAWDPYAQVLDPNPTGQGDPNAQTYVAQGAYVDLGVDHARTSP